MAISKYTIKFNNTEPTLKEKQDINYVNIQIASMVELARMEKGFTQGQLAKKVGTKQPSIARLESGAFSPSISFLNRIAKALDTHLIEPRFAYIEHHYLANNTEARESTNISLNMPRKQNFESIVFLSMDQQNKFSKLK